jgi:lantibiotic modifying enzyme
MHGQLEPHPVRLVNWQPIVTGEEAHIVREHVLGIAESLRSIDRKSVRLDARTLADVALFFHQTAWSLEREDYKDLADSFMDEAVLRLSNTATPPPLFGGFCGIALISDCFSVPSANGAELGQTEDANESVDSALIELLQLSPWRNTYDLIGGLVGYGAYFSGRLHLEQARVGFELIVARLDDLKTPSEGGFSWHTPPHFLPAWQRTLYPDGYFNLGVAHGVSGILTILAVAVANGIATERATSLLEGLICWLRAVRQDPVATGSTFPTWWMPGQEPSPSGQAWCYGDPGLGAAWLWASILVGDSDSRQDALDVLGYCADSYKRHGIHANDAGLCHGAVGLGHLFNRVYQATGDSLFKYAATKWFQYGLGLRGLIGYGGYQSYNPGGFGLGKDADENPWEDDASMLTGSTGIGLGYLAAISDIAPDWDRFFLLTLPPKGQ